MIGALAPGESGVLTLVAGMPAWSFFWFLPLLDCAPIGSGWGNWALLSSRISWQVLRLNRSTAARPKFSSFAECRQNSQQRERRWQPLAAPSDSLHTGLIVARWRIFRTCGTVAKGPATGQLLATACGTRDSLRIGQAMAGSRVFRVYGKTGGRVAMRRWGLGCPTAGERAGTASGAPPGRGERAGRDGQKKEQGLRPCSDGSGGDERLLSSCADDPPRPDQPDRCRRGARCRARGRQPAYHKEKYGRYFRLRQPRSCSG